jgi:hypothetical protein
MKNPTMKEKVQKYEEFLHLINLMMISGESDSLRTLLNNADNWSYAHRKGNGELSEREQQRLINEMFHRLCDTELNKK